jgi:hypothetical protein
MKIREFFGLIYRGIIKFIGWLNRVENNWNRLTQKPEGQTVIKQQPTYIVIQNNRPYYRDNIKSIDEMNRDYKNGINKSREILARRTQEMDNHLFGNKYLKKRPNNWR